MGSGGKLYRDHGVVLRTQKLGEADRIITVFTRKNGRVRAVAKGVRKTSSRFGSRLEPFTHIDVQLYAGRSLHIVNQVDIVDAWGLEIAGDYARYTVASAIVETAERLTEQEHEPMMKIYFLVLGALRTLHSQERNPQQVLDAFLLRAMSAAGWPVALAECAVCGQEGTHRAFSVPAGGCVCDACRPAGSVRPSVPSLIVMRALADGDWDTAQTGDSGIRREVNGLVAAYTQWHLEKGLRSLAMVQR